MKKQTLGFGFLSLSIYLIGIYSLTIAISYLKSKPPFDFSVRLAFLDNKFDVLTGIQTLIFLYFIISIVFFFNTKKDTASSITSIGFWALSSSTFLFGIKFLIFVLAFLESPELKIVGLLYKSDWIYYIFEWMIDILFYVAVILFLIRLIIWIKKLC